MAQWPFVPRLDRRIITDAGVHSAGVTTWTLPCSAVGMDAIVLSDDFEFDTGRVVIPTTATGTTVTATGDYSGKSVMIGRYFDFMAELSQVFRRDFNGNADLSSSITIRSVETQHRNSGKYTLRNKLRFRDDRVKDFELNGDTSISKVGKLRQWAPGRAENTRIIIESSSHKPVTIAGVEMLVDVDPLMG